MKGINQCNKFLSEKFNNIEVLSRLTNTGNEIIINIPICQFMKNNNYIQSLL